MFNYSQHELLIANKIADLKTQSGSHSPSLTTFHLNMPELDIKVDACFLSNPYATELFLKYFNDEILATNRFRNLIEYYPSQNAVIAKLLGDFLHVDASNILIGNGAIEIIQAVIQKFTQQKILIVIPTFSPYYEYVPEGIDIVFFPLDKANEYKLNVFDYIQLVQKEKPDTIVLINPNNPNGAYIDHQDMERILKELQFVGTIILDESFVHFAYDDHNFEMLTTEKLVADYPNLVLIKSMSKDFGIAGVRAGYGVMSEPRVQALLQKGYLWNSNCLAEYFFKLYVRPDFAAQYEQIRINYIQESILFFEELSTIPTIKTYPSKANFVLVELLNGMSSKLAVSLLLMRYGIYVRTCEDKIGLTGEFIRVASRSKEENSYIIQSFRDLFQQIDQA